MEILYLILGLWFAVFLYAIYNKCYIDYFINRKKFEKRVKDAKLFREIIYDYGRAHDLQMLPFWIAKSIQLRVSPDELYKHNSMLIKLINKYSIDDMVFSKKPLEFEYWFTEEEIEELLNPIRN